uniref:UHRF1-binding protein 1-like n=1 Tax=Noccaea caerulescens TaxID=107243 RepID=A0A1J3FWM1_NOCCA
MESILARALEYTLKYWLKSFTRDQFKLQGRTAQLSNLDINGEAIHASMGLPPALSVTTAKVGKLEIMLPYVSNVQTEPVVVQIDKLDLVLEENPDADVTKGPSSAQSPTASGKSNGYGFADKIADGMTLQVKVVNLLLETGGGAHREGGAAWAAPLASITIRNLVLYTTNESWKVVNLKEARDFSTNTGFIYLFKKLEWEALSIDLLPHPDMFTEANLARSEEGNFRDDDGAKRVFFGGERFLEGISGQAYITVQRTALNSPLGLEVQLHIPEAVCPALSEPGLRALLRFLTGMYLCLNRGDVDPRSQQSAEAAGRSLVSVLVDHVFLCIKDAEFQLELLMQSLLFSRACVSDGESANYLTKILIGGLFLRDAFSRSPCALVQPSMKAAVEALAVPEFANNFCPLIYPLDNGPWQLVQDVPLISLHSLQVKPSPKPPHFFSKTVIQCQPLMVHLQEEACLRISSFLADGIVVNPGDVLPDSSVNSLLFTLKELDVSVPLDMSNLEGSAIKEDLSAKKCFAGARLHIENLSFAESPTLKVRLLNLEKDPACFCLWPGQPIDASQKKWTAGASHFSLALETSSNSTELQSSRGPEMGLWNCVEGKDVSIEVAMVSADGKPLITIPPPGGIVRIGVACEQYISNASVEQLFFVLDLYSYFGKVSEKISIVKESKRQNTVSLTGGLLEKVPSDTAVKLALKDLQLKFLESSFTSTQDMPLVQFLGKDLSVKVTHRTLGGAIAVSSNIYWENIEVDCVDTDIQHEDENSLNGHLVSCNGSTPLRRVFWVVNGRHDGHSGSTLVIPFLDISVTNVIPLSEKDMECHSLSIAACISGVRLGGGMSYTEALLHRFGILNLDGGPGEGLSRGLEHLSSGPLSKLFKASIVDDRKHDGTLGDLKGDGFLHLGRPDDIDVSVELRDWLFALEGREGLAERWCSNDNEDIGREERCWHTNFRTFRVIAKSTPKHVDANGTENQYDAHKYPVDSVIVSVEGLQTLKPQMQKGTSSCIGLPSNGVHENGHLPGGVNLEANIVASEDKTGHGDSLNWVAESLKFSVKQPVEVVVTKDELQHLTFLCKSEVDAMGRIVAGVLRVLKLEESVGQAALNQLSNLGSEGFDKMFSPKASRAGTPKSSPFAASADSMREMTSRADLESTISSIEEASMELDAKCSALASDLSDSGSSAKQVNDLKQKLESLQSLMAKLRTQI